MENKKETKSRKRKPSQKPYIPQLLNKKVLDNYTPETLEELRTIFVENLKAVETEWNLNRTTIGRICGVSKTTASQWFHGLYWPRMGNLMALAKHINRNPNSFFKKNGIHIGKSDGGFNVERVSRRDPGAPLGDNPTALQELYDELTVNSGVNLEKEAMAENFVKELGEITDTEKLLIANWRLLPRSSQAYILHAMYMESRYTKDLLGHMNDSIGITVRQENKSKEETDKK